MQSVEKLYSQYPQLFIYHQLRSMIMMNDFKRIFIQYPNIDAWHLKDFSKYSLQEIINNLYTSKYPVLVISHYIASSIRNDDTFYSNIHTFSKSFTEILKRGLTESEKEALKIFHLHDGIFNLLPPIREIVYNS